MPLQNEMHLVSVDDHLIEPPHVWSDRLPKKYTESGPTLIESGHDGVLRPYSFALRAIRCTLPRNALRSAGPDHRETLRILRPPWWHRACRFVVLHRRPS